MLWNSDRSLRSQQSGVGSPTGIAHEAGRLEFEMLDLSGNSDQMEELRGGLCDSLVCNPALHFAPNKRPDVDFFLRSPVFSSCISPPPLLTSGMYCALYTCPSLVLNVRVICPWLCSSSCVLRVRVLRPLPCLSVFLIPRPHRASSWPLVLRLRIVVLRVHILRPPLFLSVTVYLCRVAAF